MTTTARRKAAIPATTKPASSGKTIGYIRVSSVGQNDARQLDGVTLDKTFTDKGSGKDTQRPQLQAMLEFVREGDHVYVHSMDRLARNLDDVHHPGHDIHGGRFTDEHTDAATTGCRGAV